ncbi:MAG: hypothetical protein AAB336_06020 [Acidobacteriota bacterium]
MDEIIKISQGLLTPVIAIVTCYIAYQQWKTNRDKLNLDRYERRLEVYKEVISFISIGIREANYENNELMSFKPKVSEADFLFGEEIPKYINELQKRAVNLSYWNKEYRDFTQSKPENYDHEKVVEGKHTELVWISSQLEPARKLFKKYLDVSK